MIKQITYSLTIPVTSKIVDTKGREVNWSGFFLITSCAVDHRVHSASHDGTIRLSSNFTSLKAHWFARNLKVHTKDFVVLDGKPWSDSI